MVAFCSDLLATHVEENRIKRAVCEGDAGRRHGERRPDRHRESTRWSVQGS